MIFYVYWHISLLGAIVKKVEDRTPTKTAASAALLLFRNLPTTQARTLNPSKACHSLLGIYTNPSKARKGKM